MKGVPPGWGFNGNNNQEMKLYKNKIYYKGYTEQNINHNVVLKTACTYSGGIFIRIGV